MHEEKNKKMELTGSINKLIPDEYKHKVKCFHLFTRGQIPEGSQSLSCVICTSLGNVIEISEFRVIKFCKISSKTAECIRPILVYNEDHINWYYIIQLPDNKLEIVSRTPNLHSDRIEENVKEWNIDIQSGYPELKVCSQAGSWRQVLIAMKGVSKEKENPLNVIFKKLTLNVQKSTDRLNAKQRLKVASMKDLISNSTQLHPLTVKSCNYVIHHGKSIVVLTLHHTGKGTISNISLLAVVEKQRARLVCSDIPERVTEGMELTVVGGIYTREPFLQDMHIAVSYQVDGKHFTYSLPHHNLTPQDVFDKASIETLGLPEMCKVLRYGSGYSEHWQFCYSVARTDESWRCFLVTLKSGLLCLLRGSERTSVWTYKGSITELSGAFIIVQPQKNYLEIYCRDKPQQSLFRVLITSKLPEGVKLTQFSDFANRKLKDSDPQTAIDALEDELSWLSDHCTTLSKPTSNEQYNTFYEELMQRSALTDTLLSYVT